MQIIRLEAENIKRLKAVSITPEGSIVEITGRNAQGKSSVLDSIAYLLGGERLVPSKPIRDGQETAFVRGYLGDTEVELEVERRWRNGRSTLTVKTPDGLSIGKAQAALNDIIGLLSFDPLAFTRMPPKQQAQTLRELAGIDTTELDAERARLFEERTIVRRRVKELEAQASAIAVPDGGFPDGGPVNIQDLIVTAGSIRESNRKLDLIGAKIQESMNIVSSAAERIKQLESEIEACRADIENQNAKIMELEKQRESIGGYADIKAVESEMASAENINASIRLRDQRADLVEQAAKAQKESDDRSSRINQIDGMRVEMIENANMPIPGLGLEDGEVTYNGTPFDQISSAEQLKVSVAMGLAMNPKLKVILIRDGSLLDSESMATIGRMADESGAQIWIETVSDGDARGVVIEDGMVA